MYWDLFPQAHVKTLLMDPDFGFLNHPDFAPEINLTLEQFAQQRETRHTVWHKKV